MTARQSRLARAPVSLFSSCALPLSIRVSYFSYNIIAYVQFRHSEFPCGDSLPSGVTFSSCPVQGSEVLRAYDLDLLPLWSNIVILFGMVVVFRVSAYFMLRKNTKP